MVFVFVAIVTDLPTFWQKLNLQTGVCKSFYASFHLHCYREPPKALQEGLHEFIFNLQK
jgi:hypothetical protein